jgi:succinate-semialdehyde dehydrogenase/glutarate-semialdehyde dehydrogenase
MTVMLKKFPTSALIGGEWVTSGKTFPVLDPVTGREIASVPNLSTEHATRAINAATIAFEPWSRTTAKERAAILKRWFDLVTAETESLALLLTSEQGKPLSEARAEIAYGASYIEWFAEEAKRAYGRTIPTTASGKRYLTLKQPVGVVAAIAPWNFPVAMITRKVAPALAAGCTIVVKPSEETPLSALALATLAVDAGVPAGVLNVITTLDAPAVGGVFCADARVRKLSFTGSTTVGSTLYRQCADTVKKLTLELGGNAPLIVFDDADIDQAVAGAMASKFRNAGQTCVCTNRILVQSGIFDRFTAALAEKARKLLVATGTHPKAAIGPLINDAAIARVERLVTDARAKGAKVVTGGTRDATETRFYRPTVLTGIAPAMEIAREEIFGPVAALATFETEDEAVRMANETPFGLAAYLFSRDLARAWRVAERIEAGMVGINEGLISSEVVPFGGIKRSGLGREGAIEGLDEYLETKFVCVGGLDTGLS